MGTGMGIVPDPTSMTGQPTPPTTFPGRGLSEAALFLDFDGTLVDIAAGPDLIKIPDRLPGLLADVHRATGGALALVSGRSVGALLKFLPNVPCTLVGGHGAEMRRDGQMYKHPLSDAPATRSIGDACTDFAAGHAGLEAELKPTGAVLHFRQAPHAEDAARRFATRLCIDWPDFELHDAKMAIELRPRDVGKDIAVTHLMEQPPFAGRRSVFFGDDRTDEPALALVAKAGGLSVHIGEGPSYAEFRLATPADVLNTLTRWITKEH